LEGRAGGTLATILLPVALGAECSASTKLTPQAQ